MADDQILDDENLVVEIEEGSEPEIETQGEDAGSPKVVSPQDGIAELRASLENERKAREVAEQGRVAAEERAAQGQRAVVQNRTLEIDNRLGQVTGAIETLTAQNANAKREYSAALAAGDYDRAAEIQYTLSEQAAVMTQLRQGKTNLEAQKKAPPPQPVAQVPVDPVEAFARGRHPKAQAWIREHADIVSDPAALSELNGAHLRALKAGHAENSDAYFDFINGRMGFGDKPVKEPVRKQQTVSAPVSRSAPSLTRAPSSPRTVKLTAFDVEQAKAAGIDLKVYAREKEQYAAELAAGKTTH